MRSRFVSILCLFVSATASNELLAGPTYRVEGLGFLPDTDTSSTRGINAAGQVVGVSSRPGNVRAFLWDGSRSGNPLVDLREGADVANFEPVSGDDINDDGVIVGVATFSGRHAFTWKERSVTDLTPDLERDDSSHASAINNAGQVAGTVTIDGTRRAALWDGVTMVDIAADLEARFDGEARAINEYGIVGGWFEMSRDPPVIPAFLWDAGKVTILDDLPGGIVFSAVLSINSSGQAVGQSNAEGGFHASLWEDGAITDLGELPGGGESSTAFGINDCGQIVGSSTSDEGIRAVIWIDGKLFDLNDLIGESRWVLEEASGINNMGQISGRGINPQGRSEAVRLTPIPLSNDCNGNLVVDSCDIANETSRDCNGNDVPDECDIENGEALDTNRNGIPDGCETPFTRGDGNADGRIEVSDAVVMLLYMFAGRLHGCPSALDANDDGEINLTDPVGLLAHLFWRGFGPAEPYPDCGVDPTGDGVGCEEFEPCMN